MAALGKRLSLWLIAGTVSDLVNINHVTYVTQAETPQQRRATIPLLKEESWSFSLWEGIKFVQICRRLWAGFNTCDLPPKGDIMKSVCCRTRKRGTDCSELGRITSQKSRAFRKKGTPVGKRDKLTYWSGHYPSGGSFTWYAGMCWRVCEGCLRSSSTSIIRQESRYQAPAW